ncbi:MAG: DNA internalization-related competence protein ComEC/Rec2 [Burkholderiaceae bacterium]
MGLLAGTAGQLQQPSLWWDGIYASFLLLATVLFAGIAILKIAKIPAYGLLLTACALLAFGLCGLRALQFQATALSPLLEGHDVFVTGTVASLPQRTPVGLRFRLAVESAWPAPALGQGQATGRMAQAVALPPLIEVSWYGAVALPRLDGVVPVADLQRPPADVQPGERWEMTLRLKAPHGNSNPHGFDYELWLWEQGVQASSYVRAGLRDAPPRRLAATWYHPVQQARSRVRDAIFERLGPAEGARRWAGIVAALAVGDQASVERADWDIFRATGVAHLMSISGLHITLFAWAAGLALAALWRRSRRLCLALPAQHAALVGGVLLATAYAVFSGWGLPAQRTVWMLAAVALLKLSGQRWPWPQVWLLTMTVVVLGDPWALLQPGFWLSFVAVGVLFAAEPGPAFENRSGVVRRLMLLWREQWVVTLALAPLTLLLFGQVSVVGFAANLLAIPWVTLVVTPLALLGVLVPALWLAAATALQGLALVLQALAALPWASLSVAAPPLWAGLAGVAGGVLLVMRLPGPVRALGLALVLPAVLWQPERPAPGEFDLLAADVGQGNALIVRTADHTLVYDAGPRYSAESDAGHRVLVPLLRAMGESVDTLVVSHRDADHIGGAQAVLKMQPRAQLLSSIEAQHELQLLRPARRCEAGQRWDWDGVQFEVLHPRAEDYALQIKSNALSCVLRIGNGRQTVLLTGDIEQPQEARLVAQGIIDGRDLRADVLLVPHHGSKTSSSAAFLDAVQPQWALVQAGYRNRYGHPVSEVMQRYRERQIQVLLSPGCGAARWESVGPGQMRCQRALARRYWHHLPNPAP